MIDETYVAKPGRLSDRDITYLCVGENPMISPFLAKQVGRPSAGLSSAGYDFRLAPTFLRQKYTTVVDAPIDPLNSEHQKNTWFEEEAKDGVIVIKPLECLLTATMETINMPDDVVAEVLGKSTYARCGLLVNATPLEPEWKGVITLELHNCSPIYPIVLHVGQGIAQGIFSRMANPPARTYSNRETSATYQNQTGVTTSR